jgi:hypothetical protein
MTTIPYATIVQTIKDKSKIPNYIHKQFKKYDKENNVKRIIFDDDECIEFLKVNYGPKYVNKFKYIKLGCHKADLFRYAYLYLNGGIYMDIKCMLKKPLIQIFKDDKIFYTLDTFNGIFATPPNNKIILYCLVDIMGFRNNQKRETPCIHYGVNINKFTLYPYQFGFNKTTIDVPHIYSFNQYYIRKCKKKDRWGYCNIYMTDIYKGIRIKLIKVRDNKYFPNYSKVPIFPS